MTPYDVLCLGLNAHDHLCLVPHFPQRGRKVRYSQGVVSGGGQSATAACCLARLGHRVAYAGVCGDDEAGRRAAPWLRSMGVDPVGLVTKPGAASQQAFILVEEQGGERTIIWSRDEACQLKTSDLDLDLIASCKVLHLDGHFLEPSLEAARHARSRGIKVSLDGEKVYPGTENLVALCDVVVGCQDFAQRLTGLADPARALAQMATLGPSWVGRTMGEGGAELLVEGQHYFQPAFPVATVDTTGAGDVFHAGLVHAILLDQDPAQALVTASAVAAISTTGLGGRSALPDRAALEQFLAARAA